MKCPTRFIYMIDEKVVTKEEAIKHANKLVNNKKKDK